MKEPSEKWRKLGPESRMSEASPTDKLFCYVAECNFLYM